MAPFKRLWVLRRLGIKAQVRTLYKHSRRSLRGWIRSASLESRKIATDAYRLSYLVHLLFTAFATTGRLLVSSMSRDVRGRLNT
ncbi:hypothetical protein PM082_022315 [Marasmius tenuissimus]|nr:hypothetical protein PM082_022315 [Marasmius tenuissimus]